MNCPAIPFHEGGARMKNISDHCIWIDTVIVDKYLPHIGPIAYSLYSYYVLKYNPKVGGAYPSIATMAEKLKCSKTTIINANRTLEEFCLIEITNGNRRLPNIYKPMRPSIRKLNVILKRKGIKSDKKR